jgi:hypothetical protein
MLLPDPVFYSARPFPFTLTAKYSAEVGALSCGAFDGRFCKGAAFQNDGGFKPDTGEFGGFGGAFNCAATHTPVVFVHGNGDNATSWDAPTFKVNGYARPPFSVYQQFKAAGYKDCELQGVTYLRGNERGSPQLVYEQKPEYAIVEKGGGHFHARTNTGAIILNMLTTNCSGTGCVNGYSYGSYK